MGPPLLKDDCFNEAKESWAEKWITLSDCTREVEVAPLKCFTLLLWKEVAFLKSKMMSAGCAVDHSTLGEWLPRTGLRLFLNLSPLSNHTLVPDCILTLTTWLTLNSFYAFIHFHVRYMGIYHRAICLQSYQLPQAISRSFKSSFSLNHCDIGNKIITSVMEIDLTVHHSMSCHVPSAHLQRMRRELRATIPGTPPDLGIPCGVAAAN